jgi:hypothetical protein
MLHIEPQKLGMNHKNTVNPVVAGLAGVIAGAAGVTILALADRDIRKRVVIRTKEARTSLQKWSADRLHDVQNGSDNETLEDDLRKQEEKIKEKINN